MNGISLSEIISKNKDLGTKLTKDEYTIGILSNVTVSPIDSILEYSLRLKGVNARVELGDYDNVLNDSTRFINKDAVLIFWELINLIENIDIKIERMSNKDFDEISLRFESEISYVLNELKETPLVIFNRFSTALDLNEPILYTNKHRLCSILNSALEKIKSNNVVVVDLDKIIALNGIKNTFDSRQFLNSKAPYTINFYQSYVSKILPPLLSANGLSKKVLILDCDNTLWGGIVGEDGYDSIHLDQNSKKGEIYQIVHEMILDLKDKGVMLAICSKNNPEDVEDVFKNRKDFLLSLDDFSALRVNWESKVDNILDLAKELNVGLDSFVFIDDSAFEIQNVKEMIPEVLCFQVPKNISEFPYNFKEILSFFFNLGLSEEDSKRTTMYIQESKRKKDSAKWKSQEEYLRSLELRLIINDEDTLSVARCSQLTQKTNQFNLTTKRYTEAEIKVFVESDSHLIKSFNLSDKFGDYGETGLAIIEIDENSGSLSFDTFLMSCRVIGRKVELFFIDFLINHFNDGSYDFIKSKYTRTPKNHQVSEFFDSLGFDCISNKNDSKDYMLVISKYNRLQDNFIKIEKNNGY